MAIVQLPTPVTGLVGVMPNQKFMVCTDNMTTVTTPGFLNQVNLESNPVSNTDIIQCLFSFNPQTTLGSYAVFSVAINGSGVITLTATGKRALEEAQELRTQMYNQIPKVALQFKVVGW